MVDDPHHQSTTAPAAVARKQALRPSTAATPAENSISTLHSADTAARLHAELSVQVRSFAEELDVPVTFVKTFGDPHTVLRDSADRGARGALTPLRDLAWWH